MLREGLSTGVIIDSYNNAGPTCVCQRGGTRGPRGRHPATLHLCYFISRERNITSACTSTGLHALLVVSMPCRAVLHSPPGNLSYVALCNLITRRKLTWILFAGLRRFQCLRRALPHPPHQEATEVHGIDQVCVK